MTRQKSLVSAVLCEGRHVPAGPGRLGWQRAMHADLGWVQQRHGCWGGEGSRERGRETPVGKLLGCRATSPAVPCSIEGHFCGSGQ